MKRGQMTDIEGQVIVRRGKSKGSNKRLNWAICSSCTVGRSRVEVVWRWCGD